jgi:hypothetical protein
MGPGPATATVVDLPTDCNMVQLTGMPDDTKTEIVRAAPDDATDADIPNPLDAAIDEAPPLVVGPPFAISHDCDLLTAHEAAPGCVIVMRCDCGQVFKANLLAPGPKRCPKCRVAYTHLLLVARADDASIVSEAMTQVLDANGYAIPGEEDEDEDEDDEEDEEDEDEDGDEHSE